MSIPRLRLLSRRVTAQPRPRPPLRLTTMSSPPSLPASPPPKRLKTHAQPEFPVEVGTEIHSQTSAEPLVQTALEEAPVKALFVPTGASQGGPAGPSNSKQKARKRKQKRPVPEVYSPADVLFHDIKDFLGKEFVEDILAKGDQAWEAPEDLHTQSVVELRVGAFTVSGMSRLFSSTQVTPQRSLCPNVSGILKSKEKKAVADPARHRRIHLRLATKRYPQMGHHRPVCPSRRPHPRQDISTRQTPLGSGPCGDRRVLGDVSRRRGRSEKVPGERVQVFRGMVSGSTSLARGSAVVSLGVRWWVDCQIVDDWESCRFGVCKMSFEDAWERSNGVYQWRVSAPTPPISVTARPQKAHSAARIPTLLLPRPLPPARSEGDHSQSETMGLQNQDHPAF